MHDRRIDGQVYTFGNAGGLYLGAMTWWDHQTQSIWSQPIGEALQGELAGTRLDLLPSQVTTWGSWLQSHPQSFVMINDVEKLGPSRQGFREGFVIGVVIDEEARAYYFQDVAEKGAIHDLLAGLSILVWAEGSEFRVYLRRVNDRVLNFEMCGEYWCDVETGSRWDMRLGLAREGELAGTVLQPLPSLTSFDWAWNDFYPFSGFYGR